MDRQKMVEEFHIKNDYPVGNSLKDDHRNSSIGTDNLLSFISSKLIRIQNEYQIKACQLQSIGDPRLYRLLLMIEELGEIAEAMYNGDENELADGLGDLSYVVNGTAVTYNIPMKEVFAEIHRANMAKKQRSSDDPRMRDKGKNWLKPDIIGAIGKGRGIECKVCNKNLRHHGEFGCLRARVEGGPSNCVDFKRSKHVDS